MKFREPWHHGNFQYSRTDPWGDVEFTETESEWWFRAINSGVRMLAAFVGSVMAFYVIYFALKAVV